MDPAAIYSLMRQYRYGVISSLSADGTPQSALVGIAITHQLEVIFDTLRTIRKYANLTRSSRCSFVIGWGGEQTVQLEGKALEPEGPALETLRETYFETWPDGRERSHWPHLTYFLVKPTWIRYSDYDKDPPEIAEWTESDLVEALRSLHP